MKHCLTKFRYDGEQKRKKERKKEHECDSMLNEVSEFLHIFHQFSVLSNSYFFTLIFLSVFHFFLSLFSLCRCVSLQWKITLLKIYDPKLFKRIAIMNIKKNFITFYACWAHWIRKQPVVDIKRHHFQASNTERLKLCYFKSFFFIYIFYFWYSFHFFLFFSSTFRFEFGRIS